MSDKTDKKKEDEGPDSPPPLGTDPAALGADGKAQFATIKDTEKAEKDGVPL